MQPVEHQCAAYQVSLSLTACHCRRDRVGSLEVYRPEKVHFESMEYHLAGLDCARRARVAPHLEQIMRQTHQTPLPPNFGQAAQQKPEETTRLFDMTKHRFHDH